MSPHGWRRSSPAELRRLAFDPMSEGNATLEEAFRHHAWANRTLLAFCAHLPPEQLSQPRPAPLAGDHGSILETIDHIVASDGAYLGALTGNRPAWAVDERSPSPDLGELASRASRIERWDDVPAVSEDFKRARDVIVARVTGLLEDPTLGT